MFAVMTVFGTVAYFGSGVHAQNTAPTAPGSKIRIVNIAKVLRNYSKANALGQEITTIRKTFLEKMNAQRVVVETKKAEMMKPTTPQTTRDQIEKDITAIQRGMQDLDRDAQKTLGEMSNKTIVKVYMDIKDVIDRIASANGLELILCYPDASLPAEENSPAVAQLKLQTPAAMPFYHRGLDITDFVIDALNKANPVAPQSQVQPGASSGIQPTGGTPMQP